MSKQLMTTEELLKLYASGEKDFTNLELIDYGVLARRISGFNLSRSDFRGTNFRGMSNFFKVDLSETNWSGNALEEMAFDEADLSRANLSNVRLWQSGFRNANLCAVNLSHANIRESDFRNVNLRRAKLINATVVEADFRNSDLTEANFTGARLDFINFSGTNLTRTNLIGAKWNIDYFEGNIKLKETFLKGTIFDDTIMPDGSVRSNI